MEGHIVKDPAFLFYSQDFVIGTQFFTDQQVGQYVRLLMAQHQHGHLSKKQMKVICPEIDQEVMVKFITDENGLFYNERLENEMIKRDRHCKKQSENAKRRYQTPTKSLPNDLPNNNQNPTLLEDENEIENENRNENEKEGLQGEIIVMPFEGDQFADAWQVWLKERRERRIKAYTHRGEQAALHNLQKISGNNSETAIEIIRQSIVNGWQGLFELKQQKGNGNRKPTTATHETRLKLARQYAGV